MTNKEAWSVYKDYTASLSENSRKLAFGGIAVCWLFHDDRYRVPAVLDAALLGFSIFFLVDFAQYAIAASGLRRWIRGEEHRLYTTAQTIEGDYAFPRALDRMPAALAIVKQVVLAVSMLVVIAFVGGRALAKHGGAPIAGGKTCKKSAAASDRCCRSAAQVTECKE